MLLPDIFAEYAIAISFYLDHTIGIVTPGNLIEVPMPRPMGMAVASNGLWLVSRQGISFFDRISHEDKQFYRQAFTRHSGHLDAHELVVVGDRAVFANTKFNCLAAVHWERDFQLVYQPAFVKELVPEDRAHINGIAMEHGGLHYLTCFAPQDSPGNKSWKDSPYKGVVWDVLTEQPVITDLILPHSPRVVDDKLLVCDSGRGRVLIRDGSRLDCLRELGSFTRGILVLEDFIIVGTSKVRENPRNFQLDEAAINKVNRCGLHLFCRRSLELLDQYYFDEKKEIFDLQLLPQNHFIVTVDAAPYRYVHLL